MSGRVSYDSEQVQIVFRYFKFMDKQSSCRTYTYYNHAKGQSKSMDSWGVFGIATHHCCILSSVKAVMGNAIRLFQGIVWGAFLLLSLPSSLSCLLALTDKKHALPTLVSLQPLDTSLGTHFLSQHVWQLGTCKAGSEE